MGPDATRRSLDETAYPAYRLGRGFARRRHLVATGDRHRAAVLVQWGARAGLAHAVHEPPDRVEGCARAAEHEQRGVEGAHRARQSFLRERYRQQQYAEAGAAEDQLERLHVE